MKYSNTKIFKNLAYQVGYEILIMLLPIITSPYISRVLGATNIGIYSYTYNIVNYFILFSVFGIKYYGNREISRCRDDKDKLSKVFSEIVFLHALTSFISIIAYTIYLIFFAEKEYLIYEIIQGIYLLASLFDISWLYFGLEEFKLTVSKNILIKMLSVICIFAFVKNNNDLWIYIFVIVVSNLIGQLYLWAYIKKYIYFRKIRVRDVLSHIPNMSVLFISTLALGLYSSMGKIVVGIYASKHDLGLYENADRLIVLSLQLMGALGTVMLPRMSNIVENEDFDRGQKYISLSIRLILWVAFSIMFGLMGVADVFSSVYWGAEFKDNSILIKLLVILLPIKGLGNVLVTQQLLPNKIDKGYTMSICTGAIVNIILNILLIPKYYAIGAIIGTIISETIVFLIQITLCSNIKIIKSISHSVKYGIVGIIMMLITSEIGQHMKTSITTLIIQVVIGGLFYLSCTLIIMLISKDETDKNIISTINSNIKGIINKVVI